MIGIGKQFPEFSLTGVVTSDIQDAFKPFNSSDFDLIYQKVKQLLKINVNIN